MNTEQKMLDYDEFKFLFCKGIFVCCLVAAVKNLLNPQNTNQLKLEDQNLIVRLVISRVQHLWYPNSAQNQQSDYKPSQEDSESRVLQKISRLKYKTQAINQDKQEPFDIWWRRKQGLSLIESDPNYVELEFNEPLVPEVKLPEDKIYSPLARSPQSDVRTPKEEKNLPVRAAKKRS